MKVLSNSVTVDNSEVASSLVIEDQNGKIKHILKVVKEGTLLFESEETLNKDFPSLDMCTEKSSDKQTSTEAFVQTHCSGTIAEAKPQKKKSPRWTVEEEQQVFKMYFDGYSIQQIADASNGRRGYNAIYMRLIKLKEDFTSNDPGRYGAVEQFLLNHGIIREQIKNFILSISLKPLKHYNKS